MRDIMWSLFDRVSEIIFMIEVVALVALLTYIIGG